MRWRRMLEHCRPTFRCPCRLPHGALAVLDWYFAQGCDDVVRSFVLDSQLALLEGAQCCSVVAGWCALLDPMGRWLKDEGDVQRPRLFRMLASALADLLFKLTLDSWSDVVRRLREELTRYESVAALASAAVAVRTTSQLRCLFELAGGVVPKEVERDALQRAVGRCLEVGVLAVPFETGPGAVAAWLLVHACDWVPRLRLAIDLQLRDTDTLVAAAESLAVAVAPDAGAVTLRAQLFKACAALREPDGVVDEAGMQVWAGRTRTTVCFLSGDEAGSLAGDRASCGSPATVSRRAARIWSSGQGPERTALFLGLLRTELVEPSVAGSVWSLEA